MTVELVDAATLIQSEKVAKNNIVKIDEDGVVVIFYRENGSTVQEVDVEVVDAATLLDYIPDHVETKTFMASAVTIGDHEQT